MGLFKKKTEAERLHSKYEKLMNESYQLSHIDRRRSDEKYAEAQHIMEKITELEQASA